MPDAPRLTLSDLDALERQAARVKGISERVAQRFDAGESRAILAILAAATALIAIAREAVMDEGGFWK